MHSFPLPPSMLCTCIHLMPCRLRSPALHVFPVPCVTCALPGCCLLHLPPPPTSTPCSLLLDVSEGAEPGRASLGGGDASSAAAQAASQRLVAARTVREMMAAAQQHIQVGAMAGGGLQVLCLEPPKPTSYVFFIMYTVIRHSAAVRPPGFRVISTRLSSPHG